MARRTSVNRTRSTRRTPAAIKLSTKEGPVATSWVGLRWMRYFESHADPHTVAMGITLARQSVVRRLDIGHGSITALLHGRGEPKRTVTLAVATYDHEFWERLTRSMADQSLFAAKLLAGDLPRDVEDLFAPMGIRLFPSEPDDVKLRVKGPQHDIEDLVSPDVCCVAAIIAERLDSDPFLLFHLRGIPEDEFRERLRQRRALAGAASGLAPAYAPKPIEAAQTPAQPLETLLDDFWSGGEGLDDFETPLARPQVSHALLRRLGPSPFHVGKFPLVGLLATCYDTISESAIRGGAEPQLDEAENPADPDDV
ncbi:MAG: hypothetical protein H6813_07190 [Phycisphaeraceae bacterium]|nr:hypothetical protein [Phycisphaeraceae bacterium]MCB9848281.1 hypothetical protein [Phycisphaeraceae bacterium]